MTPETEPRLQPLADAIEEALLDWRKQKPRCDGLAGCEREDCSIFKTRGTPADCECRARSEYIAAKISGAAIEYAEAARTPEWRCFFCDEVFDNRQDAAYHFGCDTLDEPACKLNALEGGILQLLRQAQKELNEFHQEDNANALKLYALGGEHAAALRREEERGYAKGVAEGLVCRDPPSRINELLRSNNELLERARKAEAEVALVRQEIARMGEKVAAQHAKPTRRLYLDLDGVMADFDAHFPATFGLDHRDMADDTMWATINAHPTYFRDMPPCSGAIGFFKSIEHLRPIILTACPRSNYENAATQKRAWVRQHLSPHVTVLPVMGGRHKPLFMQELGDILIDDWEKNTLAWAGAGGVAILHRSFDQTRIRLAELLEGP